MSRNEAAKQKKIELRTRFRARRDALTDDQASRGSQAICRQLGESKWLRSRSRLGGYAALGREVDVRPFLTDSIQRGVEIYLPRVVGPRQMVFCAVQSWDTLTPGAFGIDEPPGPPVSTDCIEVFLVPGLAFDHGGQRLGFGKGFYDRALPAVGEALAIGVGYHWQLLHEQLPAEPHDRPLDWVVTDRGWHRPPRLDSTSQEE